MLYTSNISQALFLTEINNRGRSQVHLLERFWRGATNEACGRVYRIAIPPQVDEHQRISTRWILCCAERWMEGQKGGPQVDWNIGLISIKYLL